MARRTKSRETGTDILNISSDETIISGTQNASDDYETNNGSETINTVLKLNQIQVDNKLVDENTVNIYELQFVGYAGNIKQYRSK